MKKKAQKEGGECHPALASAESKLFCELQQLVEHCCARSYDDGDPREPGWFTVKTVGAAWVCQVKDPDSKMSFQVVGATLDAVLQDVCLLLSCEEAPWEHDPWLENRGGKKPRR